MRIPFALPLCLLAGLSFAAGQQTSGSANNAQPAGNAVGVGTPEQNPTAQTPNAASQNQNTTNQNAAAMPATRTAKSTGVNSTDEANAQAIDQRLSANSELNNVVAHVDGNKVTLTGTVAGREQVKAAKDIVNAVIPGAKIVSSDLQTLGNVGNLNSSSGGGAQKAGKNTPGQSNAPINPKNN